MKKIIKLRSTCITILVILVAMLATNVEDVTNYNIAKHLNSDCESVANYITNNVDLFAKKYNESSETKGLFKATYVEDKFEITVKDIDTMQKGIFLDFNEDNGYAIVIDGYNLCDFEITGESPYKNIKSEEYCYSTISGYLYFQDGEYLSVNNGNENEDFEIESSYQMNKDGTCGGIYDLDEYILYECDGDWRLSKSKTLLVNNLTAQQMKYTLQKNLTCYKFYEYDADDDLDWVPEGNCSIVSSYLLLQSLTFLSDGCKTKAQTLVSNISARFPKMTKLIKYNPKTQETDIYNKYFDSNDNCLSGNVSNKDKTSSHAKVGIADTDDLVFPHLYIITRNYAVLVYDKVIGLKDSNVAEMINGVGSMYGYDFKAGKLGLFGNKEAGVTSITNNLPFIICTSSNNNSGYGNHAIVSVGYKIYEKTSGFGIFKTTTKKLFYEVFDLQNTGEIYFDMTKYTWMGTSSLILLNKYDNILNKNGIKY